MTYDIHWLVGVMLAYYDHIKLALLGGGRLGGAVCCRGSSEPDVPSLSINSVYGILSVLSTLSTPCWYPRHKLLPNGYALTNSAPVDNKAIDFPKGQAIHLMKSERR